MNVMKQLDDVQIVLQDDGLNWNQTDYLEWIFNEDEREYVDKAGIKWCTNGQIKSDNRDLNKQKVEIPRYWRERLEG